MHLQKIAEHLEEIEGAIKVGVERRPATIGMHTSACSTELLELYLHKTGRIPIGKVVKHDWFKPPKPGQKIRPLAERMLPIEFPEKERIFRLLYAIEEQRTRLVYGRPEQKTARMVLDAFLELRRVIEPMLEKEGVRIED